MTSIGKICLILLGTSKYTSIIAVLSDLGRFPISIKALGIGIKYWNNISCGNSPNELLSKALIHSLILKNLHGSKISNITSLKMAWVMSGIIQYRQQTSIYIYFF